VAVSWNHRRLRSTDSSDRLHRCLGMGSRWLGWWWLGRWWLGWLHTAAELLASLRSAAFAPLESVSRTPKVTSAGAWSLLAFSTPTAQMRVWLRLPPWLAGLIDVYLFCRLT
jgi:hypothetical protein